ncbi:NAD(P)H:quinone oxidoreductase [Streptomyces sp. G-G2]|uniref:NAD(P)H:quinone oxidoreductase n=1 Tax=Streptomyces sp. G-G2 TaxID=3046201 RepID=UPI0024B87829|nr:NAD(P)H:quinone oxidoreductase [Streptomyces sp. G-G2]MDJ0382909.1 NAD(P)H:quinone oxidoreductase [Streptomyces sp. G-G2]
MTTAAPTEAPTAVPTDPSLAVNVAVIYYSATGHVTEIAREIAETAEKAGAEVRLRKVAELAQQSAIDANPVWARHAAETAAIPVATPDDLLWADAVLFGSPTRFGNVSAQLKQFLDSLGPAWSQGLLADKVYGGFTSTASPHGGQESTLLALTASFHHFGGIVVAPGYTHPDKFTDGNPYGTAHWSGGKGSRPVDDTTRNAARAQAERVVRFARAVKHA